MTEHLDVERWAEAERRVAAMSYRHPAKRDKALADRGSLDGWLRHTRLVAAEYARLSELEDDDGHSSTD